jgi:hypothetical protein
MSVSEALLVVWLINNCFYGPEPEKVRHLALGLNERGIGAQFLVVVVSRLAPWPTRFLTSEYWELVPQGIKRPGRETDLSLPFTHEEGVVCVWWGV